MSIKIRLITKYIVIFSLNNISEISAPNTGLNENTIDVFDIPM